MSSLHNIYEFDHLLQKKRYYIRGANQLNRYLHWFICQMRHTQRE